MGQCPDRRAGPLTIYSGQAHYTTATGRKLRGSVGPQGELAMRMVAPPSSGGGIRPFEISVSGNVDGAMTVGKLCEAGGTDEILNSGLGENIRQFLLGHALRLGAKEPVEQPGDLRLGVGGMVAIAGQRLQFALLAFQSLAK